MDKIELPQHLKERISRSPPWRVPKRIFFIYPSFQSDDKHIKNELIHEIGEGLVRRGHSVIVCKMNIPINANIKNESKLPCQFKKNGPIQYVDVQNNSSAVGKFSKSLNTNNNLNELLRIYKPALICIDLGCKDFIEFADTSRLRKIPYAIFLSSKISSEISKGGLEQKSRVDRVLKYADLIYAQRDITDSELGKFGISKEFTNYRNLPSINSGDLYKDACIELLANASSRASPFSLLSRSGENSDTDLENLNQPDSRGKLDSDLYDSFELTQDYFSITNLFEVGVSYKVSGQFEPLGAEIKNPALIQFRIEGVQDLELIKTISGLSYSETTGFYKYLNPVINGSFEFSITIPDSVEIKNIGIRTWGSIKKIAITNFIVQAIGRPLSLSEAQIKHIESDFLVKGLEASKQAMLSQKNIKNNRLADQLEQLFYAGFSENLPKLEDLILTSYSIDPSLVRGRRLINKSIERGMLKTPSIIAEDLLSKSICSLDEEKNFKRVISKFKLCNKPISVPVPQVITDYEIDKAISLYFVYSSLPYQSSGYATRSQRLLTALNNSRGRSFITYSRPGYPWDIGQLKESASDYDEVGSVVYRHLMGANLFKQELDVYMESAAGIVISVARNNSASVLHAASNHLNAAPVLIAARQLGLPFVYEIRGFWELTHSTKVSFDWISSESYKYDYIHETLIAKEADAVIVLTDGLKRELVSRGVASEKIVIASNGVDIEEFSEMSKDLDLAKKLGLHEYPTIGFVGSFAVYEGLDDLIMAADQLRKLNYRFNLLLVGDGPELNEIRDLIIEYDLTDVAFLTGRVPFDEVQKYYSLIDIAPFPRKSLPVCEMVSPLKPFEAMAMGKVVLASNVSAMAEFISDGENGYLFEKGSLEDLVSKLAFLIDHLKDAQEVGKLSREWVKQEKTWAGAGAVIEKVHNQLTAKWFGT